MELAQARRVLVALGGNAMTGPDGSATPAGQDAAVHRAHRATEPVADLVAGGVEVVLTHGNRPQVGNILVRNELAAHVVPPDPDDPGFARPATPTSSSSPRTSSASRSATAPRPRCASSSPGAHSQDPSGA